MRRNAKTAEEALNDDESVVQLPNATKIKLHEQNILAKVEKVNQANADVKSAYDAAEKDGIDKKSFKAHI